MRVRRIFWSITIPLLGLTIGVLAWSQFLASAGEVSGFHAGEGDDHLTEIRQDQDEIDPEACATVVHKETLGPINTSGLATASSTVLGLPGNGDVLRQQMIVKVIAACNVDDEVRDPNLERELDVEIEVFSIICEIRDDLSVPARCEVLRVAQKDNADFLD